MRVGQRSLATDRNTLAIGAPCSIGQFFACSDLLRSLPGWSGAVQELPFSLQTGK
jgi:hypothetical protein